MKRDYDFWSDRDRWGWSWPEFWRFHSPGVYGTGWTLAMSLGFVRVGVTCCWTVEQEGRSDG